MNFFEGNFSLRRYILSFALSFLVTVILCALISIVVSFFNPPHWLHSLFSGYTCYFSAFLTALFCGKCAEKNGLLTGIICADIYMLILIIAGVLIFKNSFPVNSAPKIFSITSAVGAVAGILGINLKK